MQASVANSDKTPLTQESNRRLRHKNRMIQVEKNQFIKRGYGFDTR
jgi:hypothetical protein